MFDAWLDGKMRARGWADKDAAKALEVDVSTIGRWLNGASLPERRQVAKLCDVFKVSPVTILRLTDPDVLLAETEKAARQDNRAMILAQIPDVSEAVDALLRMSPEARAAMLLLLRVSASGE